MVESVGPEFESPIQMVFFDRSWRENMTCDLRRVVETTSPRAYYPLARVVELNYGSGAIARSAERKRCPETWYVRLLNSLLFYQPRSLVKIFH